MALTASSLIDLARQRTFGIQGAQHISVPMLLAELSAQDGELVKIISQTSPDLLATTTGTLTVSDAGNTNGYTLQGGMHYRDFTHIDSENDTYTPINIVQRQYQDRGVAAPAGMLRSSSASGVFYPIDPLRKRWAGSEEREFFEVDRGHTISYSYVPLPGVLTSTSGTLSSPDMAREALVSALVVAILFSIDVSTFNEAQVMAWQTRLQAAVSAMSTARNTLIWQVTRFTHPQGQRPGASDGRSIHDRVQDHIDS